MQRFGEQRRQMALGQATESLLKPKEVGDTKSLDPGIRGIGHSRDEAEVGTARVRGIEYATEPDNENGYLPSIENVGVRLRIPEGRQARQIKGFPETSFRHEQSGQELELRFPRIDAYEGITFELQ